MSEHLKHEFFPPTRPDRHPRLKLSDHVDPQRPLYEFIKVHCGTTAGQSQEELAAAAADRRLARLLAVESGTPLLRRERVALDTGRSPMEFAVVHSPCDRLRLTLHLRQE